MLSDTHYLSFYIKIAMVKTSFWQNESAKVPLAVIGVFLLLVSVMLSINILRMNVRMAKAMSKVRQVGD